MTYYQNKFYIGNTFSLLHGENREFGAKGNASAHSYRSHNAMSREKKRKIMDEFRDYMRLHHYSIHIPARLPRSN